MRIWPKAKSVSTTVMLACALLATAANAMVTPPRRILLVYESGAFAPSALELQRGILSHLRQALGQDAEFFSEQLETTRFAETEGQAISWIRKRYAEHRIDVVIFVGSGEPDILPGVATVYAGNTPFKTSNDVSPQDNKTAVVFKVDLGKTVLAARRLQPGARRVLVITGSAYEDRVLLEEAGNQLTKSDVPVAYLTDASLQELRSTVARLPRDTIVLPISYTRDAKGNIYYSTRDVVESLSQVSAAPIYATADTTVGSGAVGGYVLNFDRMGNLIAQIVVQTLSGKRGGQISFPPEATASYVFDGRQLKKWGFSEKDLPPASIIQFKTISTWEQYRWRIIATIALVTVQFFLILRLLITQKKRVLAEASLRDMTGRLLTSQDEERRRFARDLHDGTGQHLSGVALAIGQVLANFPPGHDTLHKLLQDSHSASRQALDEVRTVSFALHPPLLDNLGLVAAVRWYLNGLQKRTRLKIDFQAPAEIRHLAPEGERALFRIVQESMNNILRHSSGDRVEVALYNHERFVMLAIEDNGIGMSAEQLAQAEAGATMGVGIAGMRERLRQLHGELKIHSVAIGTKVTATVPVDKERYAAAHSVSG